MRSDRTPSDHPDHDPVGGSAAGDGDVATDALAAVATAYHQLMRDALAAVLEAVRSDVRGRTGLSAGLVLDLDHRLPGPVVRQLEAVASRVHALPETTSVYRARLIEFHDLAAVVRASRDLNGELLAEIDCWAATRAAHLADQGLLHLLEGDVLDRVDQLRAPGWATRQERRREIEQQVTFQQDFDGGGLVFADLAPVGFAAVTTAIETVAGPPSPATPRRRQRADAMVAIADHALAGTGCTDDRVLDAEAPRRGRPRIPRTARPRMTVVIDLTQATADRFAHLVRTTGLTAAPTLSARLVETLASESELFVQVADGRRPLVELRAQDIPDAVRRAVLTRDRGCRAPGCTRPPHECDVHHIVRRSDDGPHDPDNLVALCRRDHGAIDTHAWRLTLDPSTATVTWAHPGTRRSYRTVPHGSRPPPRHPPDEPLPHWRAPPIPPPPEDEHVDGGRQPP